MPDILKIAGIYTAVILGAGFASGQEILSFFINYGSKGFYGLILSGFIFSFIGYIVLKICYIKKIDSAENFFRFILGEFYFLIEYIIALFLFISYTTMLSATGACFKQQFNLPNILGIILMAFLCFIVYILGVDFIAKINFFIAPILFLGGFFIGLFIILNNNSLSVFLLKNKSWIWVKSAILYSAYNLITGICVIIPMLRTIKNKNHAKFGTILGGFFISLLGIIIGLAIYLNYNIAIKNQIPMLAITKKISSQINLLYLLIFLLAVFTTAIGNFFSLCEILKQKKFFSPRLLISLLGIIFAQIEFSGFISKIYPLFGYIGLFEIILIFIFYLKLFF